MDVPASPRPSDTFLSEFGTPTLLWRVLQSVGYTEPPQYSWWDVDMAGELQWFAVQGLSHHMGAGLDGLGGPATQMGRLHGKQLRLQPMLCCSTYVRELVRSCQEGQRPPFPRLTQQQRSGSRPMDVRWSEVEESKLRVPVLL